MRAVLETSILTASIFCRHSKIGMATVMIGIVILVIIALCAIFVYLDASAHGIGDISEHGNSFNKSAMFWAIGTLFLWPFALPYYLRIRGQLIEAAAEHPIQENWRFLKACSVTLAAVGFISTSMAFPGLPSETRLPSCGSPETLIKLSTTLDTNSVAAMIDYEVVKISGITEIDYLTDPITRECSGMLVTPTGESSVRYIVQWEDASKRKFQVATQPVVLR